VPELFQVVRRLQDVRLFEGLQPTTLHDVAQAAQQRELDAGKFFFRQGSKADIVYVLHLGRVKLTQSTPEGSQVLLRFVSPGEMFGPMAVFEAQPYPVSAQAVRWCQAFAWNGKTLAALMEACPRLALNALRDLSARLQDLQERYRELATERVERRVAQALSRLASQAGWMTPGGVLIDLPLSRQDLAEMTGTTLYTVSRILSGWQRDRLLDIGRQRVTILDSQGLEHIADGPHVTTVTRITR
jgi:CRP-like cAMP-binding protein